MVYRLVKFIDYHDNHKIKRWHLVSSRSVSYCKVVCSDALSLSVHSRTAEYFGDIFLKKANKFSSIIATKLKKIFPTAKYELSQSSGASRAMTGGLIICWSTIENDSHSLENLPSQDCPHNYIQRLPLYKSSTTFPYQTFHPRIPPPARF